MMTHIDFIVGFILLLTILLFITNFITNTVSNELNVFNVNEIKESSSSLERELFEIEDSKSLVSTIRELQTILIEIGNEQHDEEIGISIKPAANKPHVYDTSMGEIPSTISQLTDETIISFSMNFNPLERKRVNIFYFGGSVNDIDYLSLENNISIRILSDKELKIVSKEKCSNFKTNTYDETRKIFGFKHHFNVNLDGCSYGFEPPLEANIILSSIPLLFEMPNELITTKIAKLRVW